MSRIGKNPVKLPDSVEVKTQGGAISVKGPKGELRWDIPQGIKVSVEDKAVVVERLSDIKKIKALHGTTRNIIADMVKGVSEGYQRVLEIVGVGYRAQVQGVKLIFTLGYSRPVEFTLPQGITAELDRRQTQLTLKGINKQLIGQVASDIRCLRVPDPYKGKGIRYTDEHIKLKPGKAGKK